MKTLLLFSVLSFSSLLFAQSDFQKGYLINNQGDKMEGYLKSSNYRTFSDASFSDFEFKKELDQPIQKIEKFNVTEFGTAGEVKYQKMKAMIDDVDFFKEHSNEKGFLVREETVFLKVLVEGKATLYSYDGGKGIKYLWKIADSGEVAKQFLYKKYFRTNVNLTENNIFREQLFNHVKCPNQTYKDFLNVKYEKDELVSLFKNYNKCSNSSFVVYENNTEEKIKVNFTVLLGYSIGNLRVVDIPNPTTPENFRMISIGAETELLFASRKLGVFASFEYKNGKASTEQTSPVSPSNPNPLRQVYELDATFVDIVLGARFYKNFNSASAIFVGGGVGMNVSSGVFSTYQTTFTSTDLGLIKKEDLGASPFFTLQLGYKYNKNYGIDITYDSDKNVLGNKFGGTIAKVHEFGLNFRYTF
jgi:hypothetical protein